MAKSTIAAPIAYKLNIKRAIVHGLRLIFTNAYPDSHHSLQNLQITTDWPDKPEQFPILMVTFQETDLKTAGIGHFEHFLGGPNIFKRWLYQGQVKLLIIAETSLQRDYISDHLVHALAFGSTSAYTNSFVPYVEENNGVDMQILKDTLTPQGESVEKGADWGFQDMTLYVAGYSFGVLGSFTSGVVQNAYIRGVNESARIVD